MKKTFQAKIWPISWLNDLGTQGRWLKEVKIQNNFTGVHAPGPFLEAYEFDAREENRQYLS